MATLGDAVKGVIDGGLVETASDEAKTTISTLREALEKVQTEQDQFDAMQKIQLDLIEAKRLVERGSDGYVRQLMSIGA